MNYKTGIIFMLCLCVATATGCVSHITLKEDVRTSIHLAEVSPEIKIPDKYGQGGHNFGGAVGFLAKILDKPDKEKAQKMEEMLRTEVPMMLYEQFSSTLKESKLFPLFETIGYGGKPDAIFFLTVDDYGFFYQKPLLCATGRLFLNPPVKPTWTKNRSATWTIGVENPERHPIVWEKRACEFGQHISLPTEDVKFYVKNIDITRNAFKKAAQSVVDQLIADMKEVH